jgi:hypothetical protein
MSRESVICEKKWSHVVFHHGESVFLTFLIGGVVEIDYTIQLTESEIEAINMNNNFALELINRFHEDSNLLNSRKLPCPIWPKK